MNGKVVVITGASSGFGRLTALELARRGHTVVATMRDVEGRNRRARNELTEEAESDGNVVQVIEMDVTDDASVQFAVDQVMKQYGRIDALINNAGTMFIGVTEAHTVADLEEQFEVNFFGAARANRAVLPHMRAAGSGLLVHVTSLMGRLIVPFFGAYSASKFAVEALAEAYRYELSGFGVDSVIVEPGPFPSNLLTSSPAPSDEAVLASYGPVAAIPLQIRQGANDGYNSSDPSQSQLVADAIAGLVDATDRRPLRTVVMPEGVEMGVERLNELVAPIQEEVLRAQGMSNMI